MVDGISAGVGLPAKSYVQLKNFEKLENAEVQKADLPKDKELFAGPELSAAEKAALEEKLREVFAAVVSDEAGWVNLAGLGAPLKENGVDAKQLGFQKIMPFLEQFPELLELKHEPSPSGKAWVAYARLRTAETALPAGRAGDGPSEHTARADAVQRSLKRRRLLQALRQRWQLWEATNRAKRSSRRKKRQSLARRFVRRFALRFRMKRAGST